MEKPRIILIRQPLSDQDFFKIQVELHFFN